MAVDDIRSVGVEARIEGIEGFPRSCVCMCARARVRAIGSVDSDVWTRAGDPTGPNGERGGGDPSSGLNDNPRYSIPLKRSFALVCMYYDHLQLSPPSVRGSIRSRESTPRDRDHRRNVIYGIRKS